MPHLHESLLRDAYAAFARGDIPAFIAMCTPDVVFRVPGQNRLSGTHDLNRFLAVLGPAMAATGNSFREEVLALFAGDARGVVVLVQQLERDGRNYRWQCVHEWRIRDGKLAEFVEYTHDETTFNAAWGRG
ncbi:MAG TPA: nuclear transport factor 2 family protein [Polyangia bacterium]|nr:nuclear transport factor 2 family protein [Polyangia bacterium]